MQQIDLEDLKRAQANGNFLNIGSVSTLNNSINQIYKTLGDKLENYVTFYRGHADSDFKSIPSIYRENPVRGQLFVKEEEKFCSDIIRECPAEFEKCDTAFEMLVKMQHYELPTRLLDITENPLVALYFACLEPETKSHDGQILIYFVHKEDIVNYTDLQVAAFSSISFLPSGIIKAAKNTKKINELIHHMRIYTN